MGIDFAIYAGASIPFFHQLDQLLRSGDSKSVFTEWISCFSLLIFPFYFLMISVMLRRTVGQVATQTKTISIETIAVPISLFFRREVVRTFPIWGALSAVAISQPIQVPAILAFSCFVAAMAVASWLRYRSKTKLNYDQRFGTTEIVSG